MISSLFGRIVVLCALVSFCAAFAQTKSNHAPTMNGDQIFHGVKNQVMRFTLAGASDVDQDELSYELVESQNFGELKNCLQGTKNLKCEFVPNPDFRGIASFTYKANDGVVDSQNNSKVVLRYDLNNHAPTVGIEREFSGATNKTLTFALPEGRDSDNDKIFYQLVSHNGAGTISGCFQNSESRICEYHPVNGHNETVTILYKVFDGIAASEENGQIVLRLGAVNHAPTMNGDQTFTTTKFTLAGASDADGDIVTYSLVSPTSLPALKGCLNGTSKLNCEYIPEQNERGEVVFTYRANDTKENSKNIATVKLRLGENTNTSPLAKMNCEQKSRRLTCHSTSSDNDGTISKTEWTLNGETIIGESFTRLLPADGSYKVFLKVWDNEEAEATLERSFILFNTLPQINLSCLTNGSSINCDAGLSYDPDGQIEKYEWDFADGTIGNGINIAHTYIAPGSYLVRVKATDDMGDSSFATYQVQIAPNQVPEVKFSCTTKSRTISCSSKSTDSDGAIIKEEWLFDNKSYEGLNFSHQVGQDGSYVIRLTVWDNAGAFISKEETILMQNALPQATISCQQASERTFSCQALNALDPDGSITSFEWFADDQKVAETQSATISFTASGQHFIKLKVTDDVGGFINMSYPVSLEENEEPWSNLQYQASKGSSEVVFSVMKYDAEKELESAVIDFGDGQTLELNKDTWMEQVTHVYESVGQYNIKIALEDRVGNKSENVTTVFAGDSSLVWPYLEADAFQVAPLTLGAFTYFSYSPFYDVVEFSVEWGDGQRTTDSIPQFYRHKYQAPGEYTVTFSMKDASGRTNQKTEKYSVDSSSVEASYPHPFPVYFKEGGFNSVFRFTSFSTSTSGLLANALFELGDGNSQNLDLNADNQLVPSFYHVYAPGNYSAKLTVTDANGNSNDQEANLSVFASDVYTARIRCSNIGHDVTCTVKAYSPNGTLQGANVSWGDGVTESLSDVSGTFYKKKITHHFESGGAKNIQLEIIDSANPSKTDKRTVNLPATIVNPVADFNCNTQGKKVRCGSSSATNNGELVDFVWEFDDGEKAYGPFVEHDFTQEGNHVVKLVVKDSLGLVGQIEKTVSIAGNMAPTAMMNCLIGVGSISCDGSLSHDQDGFIAKYEWDMGDGTQYEGLSVNHYYQSAGQYTVILKVTDNLGAQGAWSQKIYVLQNSPPEIINFDCHILGKSVSCSSFAVDYDGSVAGYLWELGDGTTKNGADVSYEYNDYGEYNVTLKVFDNNGAFTLRSILISIIQDENTPPVINNFSCAVNDFEVNCAIDVHSTGPYEIIYNWGDGTENQDQNHKYSALGTYYVWTRVTNDHGIAMGYYTIDILKPNIPPTIDMFCYQGDANSISCNNIFSNDIDGYIAKSQWFINGVKLGEGDVFTYTFDTPGPYVIQNEIEDNQGAVALMSKEVHVLAERRAPIAIANCYYISPYTVHCSCTDSKTFSSSIDKCIWETENSRKTGLEVDLAYQAIGFKDIRLTLTDSSSGIGNSLIRIEVHASQAPIAVPDCQIDANSLSCDGSNSYDLDRGIIVDHSWDIVGERILHGQKINLELSRFGQHKIIMRVRNSSGVLGRKEITIDAPSVYMSPMPHFAWDMGMNKDVFFDASKSLRLDRKIMRYDWEFGDNQILSTSESQLTYQYSSYGDYSVKLTVTDEKGTQSSIEKIVYVHDPVVPKPGSQSDETLLGIDINSNGIRDDVERWIYRTSKENEMKKSALLDIAEAYQKAIVSLDDDLLLKDLGDLIGLRLACLKSIETDKADEDFENLQAKIFTTKERYFVLLKLENNDVFVDANHPSNRFKGRKVCGERK